MSNELETKCFEYIDSLNDLSEFQGKSIYGLDRQRTRLHEEICELSGLTPEETWEITNNIDLSGDRVAAYLYIQILAKARKKSVKANAIEDKA
jgi:hypothetical protein